MNSDGSNEHKMVFISHIVYYSPEPHDAVVAVKSQYMTTSKGTNVIIPGQTIKGVNHVEEFNHPNTREALRSTITEGSNGPIFKN